MHRSGRETDHFRVIVFTQFRVVDGIKRLGHGLSRKADYECSSGGSGRDDRASSEWPGDGQAAGEHLLRGQLASSPVITIRKSRRRTVDTLLFASTGSGVEIGKL